MTCQACGAHNSDRAAWCTQCYGPLVEPPEPDGGSLFGGHEPTEQESSPDGPEDAAGEGGPPPPASGGGGVARGDRDVRVRDEQVEWRCSVCQSWTSLFEPACSGCGAPRAGFTPPDSAAERAPRVSVATSLVAGALLPGLGHLLRGSTGLGVAILLLFVLWAGGSLASLGGTSALTAVLLLAAVALWVAALLDIWQRGSGGAAVLSGRMLARATIAVTGLLALVAIGGGLATRG